MKLIYKSVVFAENNLKEEESQYNVQNVGTTEVSVVEVCLLLEHLLLSLPLDTQQQTQAAKMPQLLSSITNLVSENLSLLSAKELSSCLAVCHNILKRLIPSVALPVASTNTASAGPMLSRPTSQSSMNTVTSSIQFQHYNSHSNIHSHHDVSRSQSIISETPLVLEVSARESFSEDDGIVQIGIVAEEENEEEFKQEKLPNDVEDNDMWSKDENLSCNSSSTEGHDTNTSSSPVFDNEVQNSDHSELNTQHSSFQDHSLENKPERIPSSSSGSMCSFVKDNECNDDCNLNTDKYEDLSDNNDSNKEDSCKKNHLQPSTKTDGSKGSRSPDSFECELTSCPTTSTAAVDQQHINKEKFENVPPSPKVIGSPPLYSYVKEFERLFLFYIQNRVINDPVSLQDFQKLMLDSSMASKNNLVELINLLNECLHCNQDKDASSSSGVESASLTQGLSVNELEKLSESVKISYLSEEEVPVFKSACNILVDLSSIPTTTCVPVSPTTPAQLPPWLVALLVCVVCGKQVSSEFLQIAVSTLLELITLATSELSVWVGGSGAPAPNPSGGEGVVNIKIIPLLLPVQTYSLLHHTPVHQHITRQVSK